MNVKQLFHYISYLQYPLMLVAMYFVLRPLIEGMDGEAQINFFFSSLNSALIFMGLSVSFSTLQDTTKTQNEVSRKIWEDPKKGKTMLVLMALFTLFFMLGGLYGYFGIQAHNSKFKELSFGMIVFSIGWLGLLKAAIEMFENHRKDKNP